MKDILISLGIFSAMCALFIFNAYVSDDSSERVCAKIDNVCSAMEQGDEERARESFEAASAVWQREMKKMRYLYHHSKIEEAEKAFYFAGLHMEAKEYEKAACAMEEVRYVLSDLKEHEKITLDNIF